MDLARAEESGRHLVEEKGQEVLRCKEREERMQSEIEDLKKKLAESHKVLRDNHDVIDYLNRQLTERDLNLKALPTMASGMSSGSERETHSTALSELLKQTLGKPFGLKPGSAMAPSATGFSMTGISELSNRSLGGAGYG